MEKPEFKFEPVWISTLTIVSLFLIYKAFTVNYISGFKFDISVIILIFPLLLALVLLPIFFKMSMGIPAILYTADKLVDNVWGFSVDWENIQEIRMTGARKPFLSIKLKDKSQFYSSINNPIKRYLLKFLFLIFPGDVSVNLAFVAGSNESIVAITQVYWNRFYGRTD